jgi:hypothetical protein
MPRRCLALELKISLRRASGRALYTLEMRLTTFHEQTFQCITKPPCFQYLVKDVLSATQPCYSVEREERYLPLALGGSKNGSALSLCVTASRTQDALFYCSRKLFSGELIWVLMLDKHYMLSLIENPTALSSSCLFFSHYNYQRKMSLVI